MKGTRRKHEGKKEAYLNSKGQERIRWGSKVPDRVEYEGDENELEVIEGMQYDCQTKTITQRRVNHHKTYFCFHVTPFSCNNKETPSYLLSTRLSMQ